MTVIKSTTKRGHTNAYSVNPYNDEIGLDVRAGHSSDKAFTNITPADARTLAAALTEAASEVEAKIEAAREAARSQHGFKIGQRVVVNRWGTTVSGTVTPPSSSAYDNHLFVHVLIDGESVSGGWYPRNVKPDPFNN